MRAGERASAENEGADGARGGGIVESHKAAARFFLDGHLRNDGDSHAGSHHTKKAAELAALKNNLRVEAGAVARRDGGIAETVAIAEQKKGLRAQVFERQRASLCQFVARG